MQLNRLLVVIDPTNIESQPSLERATAVALQTKAAIELLICEYNSVLEDSIFSNKETQQRARTALLAERLNWLEELAAPLREQGIEVTTKVRWGKQLHQEIIAHINDSQPDVVFRNATTHGKLQRLLFSNTSWQLIRYCPTPLWLVRSGPWQSKRVAAALDPVHTADKPATLDHQLIQATQTLQNALGLEADYVHSYNPLPRSLVFEAELVVAYDSYLENTEKQHQQAFSDILEPYTVAQAQQHLLRGVADETIPRFVRKNNVDLLVLGAISRGNIENALIGNTAERVLENSDCDLLVIKPKAE